MEEKLDFSLPEQKQKHNVSGAICIVLLVVLVGLTAANLFISQSRTESAPGRTGHGLSAEQAKQLAAKLAQRNLYDRAAAVWREYLAVGELTGAERARALFQVGTLLEKAGDYAEAIECYYRSEVAEKLDELEPQINAHVKDCFERLGKFSALRYELMDRTNFKKSDEPGGKVVAEIGAEKITEADLDGMIESDIDNRLGMWAAFMTADQLNEQKKRMLEQYKGPEARQQYLQGRLAQEILYRQALEEGLTEKPEVKKLLEEQSRGVLSQYLMNEQLAAKINITETDLQTYYEAHKSNYVEPASATISHIRVDDEQQAKDIVERIKGGEDFGDQAKEFSRDEKTKAAGGRIEGKIVRGDYVSGIGNFGALNAKIFEAKAPSVLDEPFKTEAGWEIVKVEAKQPERQKGFEEVRQEVMSTLLDQKRKDVQQDYVKQLMDKYNVIVHTSAMTGKPEGESTTAAAAVKK